LLALTGCPQVPAGGGAYDLGYEDGFAEDEWYWKGYYDGYDTVEFTPVYYSANEIPELNDDSYEAGYYDGQWYAYNDGYFVDYHYAFILGFSEGYDAAFYEDYLTFLGSDLHYELDNGGWGDGYNDGFSEGRVFGANDYEQGLSFDWLDALYDYEAGTDLYFSEVDVGTGEYGPVFLYEYGTDPLAKSAASRDPGRAFPSIRRAGDAKAAKQGEIVYRPLTAEAKADLQVAPAQAAYDRSERDLSLTSTWLARIDAYMAPPAKTAGATTRARSVQE
jgi:hypothetical protein